MAVKDLVSGILAESITTSTTNILVTIAENIGASGIQAFFPTPPFYITIMPKSPVIGVANRLSSEIIKVTAVGHDQVGNAALTGVRAQRDTTAKAFSAGDIVTVGVYTDDAVLLSGTGTTETEMPWIKNGDIVDNTISRDKLDSSTNMIVRKLDEINAANIPFRTSGTGFLLDIRKYFANNSTAANRPMVFDEILLKFDISLTETSVIHYFRFGQNDGASNLVVRNMISFDESSLTGAHGEYTNAIIGMRLGSNTEVHILPYGGASRIPTLADNLTLVTLTDNSSVNFTSAGTRLNFNTLYRLQYTNYKLSLFQNDLDQTLFNGVIKVYGIKYPTA